MRRLGLTSTVSSDRLLLQGQDQQLLWDALSTYCLSTCTGAENFNLTEALT